MHRRAWSALLVWTGVVALGVVWGAVTINDDMVESIGAPPFVGIWHRQDLSTLVPAGVFALLCLLLAPRLFERIRSEWVSVIAGIIAGAWTTLLAASEGWKAVAAPLLTRYEYVPLARTITNPSSFIDTFVEQLSTYPTHVRSHPPGAPLAFWLLRWLGLDGSAWPAVLVILSWAIAVTAAIVVCREVVGIDEARRAAPFVALSPAVLWAGTSADALFAGVVTLGIALLILASGKQSNVMALALAGSGGVVLGLSLHLSYGVVPLLVIPVVVLIARGRLGLLVISGIGALCVTGLFALEGFWWIEGLNASRAQYWRGIAADRPWPYHLLAGNPSAFALATGPAWVMGLAIISPKQWRSWLPVFAGVIAVLLANASGLSKGEVERIWLPFVPWVMLGTGALYITPAWQRLLLGGQLVIALGLQANLNSPW